jgi:very-short-patch-repair endonuclease
LKGDTGGCQKPNISTLRSQPHLITSKLNTHNFFFEGEKRGCQLPKNTQMKNKIIPYNPKLREYAKELRKNSTLSEVLLWKEIKGKRLGAEFHRQVPIDEYIVDFYCHELKLAIEIDGCSHDAKYKYDIHRQKKLEKFGITFIRFDDLEVKKDITNVLRALEIVVEELKKASK